MLEWILVFLILAAAGVYILLTPKDVDPDFLEHQASVSSTQQAGESPVVRSLANPHGYSLLGESAPLSKFKFSDIWADVGEFKIQYVTRTGEIRTVDNFVHLVLKVQRAISAYPPNCAIGMRFNVCIEALICFFAIALSGRTAVLVDEMDNVEDQTETSDGTPLVVKKADFQVASGSSAISVALPGEGAIIVDLQSSAKETHVNSFGSSNFVNDVPTNNTTPEKKSPILRHNISLRVSELDYKRKTVCVSESDLGVGVAAQLTALGSQNRWNHKDRVLMAPGPLSASSFVAMLTALSAKATLTFAESDPLISATSLLEKVKPSVFVTQDESMRSLVTQVDYFQALKWLQYGWRRLRLARGALTQPPMIPGFRSVRLIHTFSGCDPYNWLSNGDISALRVLTGSQVIHTYTPEETLPLTQTSIGDYRASIGNRSNRSKAGVNWGPPLPGLELKKVTSTGHIAARYAQHGMYTTIPAEATEKAALLQDGCLYVPEKRYLFSDHYYYTGELK